MRILVIDDSGVMRKTVVKMLRQAGYADDTIDEAVDGVDGVAKIDANLPDLVLCDWNMPNLDGMGVLNHVRERGLLDRFVFGFVTTEGSDERRQQAAEGGARDSWWRSRSRPRAYVRRSTTPKTRQNPPLSHQNPTRMPQRDRCTACAIRLTLPKFSPL